MVAKNLLETVFALPMEDRVELLRRLRENLLDEARATALSPEHRRILDQRLAEFERDPEEGSTWEEVEGRIRTDIGGA
jgi:putative addiction module component (TIGR02574 family)